MPWHAHAMEMVQRQVLEWAVFAWSQIRGARVAALPLNYLTLERGSRLGWLGGALFYLLGVALFGRRRRSQAQNSIFMTIPWVHVAGYL